ncbi:MAG TPA: YhjD/YihY/BrkB family envelope integrity protein [Solirubrobacteraceae bacterium]
MPRQGPTLWLLPSAVFSLFLAHHLELHRTYGSFAAAIILLIWLWLINVALPFGAEVNAGIERQNELVAARRRPR